MSGAPQKRGAAVARMLGIGALGLVGGALLALFVQDLLATLLVRNGGVSAWLLPIFTFLMPVVSVASAVAAVLVDRRRAGVRADEDRGSDHAGDTRWE
ncbi:hypothetical protein [Microbacterium sp. JB110]|uniref:hypothetical protein n=1 Tax=Microbacterium sp. JB110 TaxID=2024477 RepID=UPI00111CE23D|nr:hypothetical protein [Microbacterium sp. JB110]